MPRIISPPSRESVSLGPAERERSTGSSDAGSMHGTGSEYSTLFHLCTSLVPLLAPTGMSEREGDNSGLADDNEHQAKWCRTNAPVAIAKGNVPLQKTWEMMELRNHKGLLKFRVGPLALS